MIRYILRRILMMIPVMLGVTLIVFTMMYITPGDPAQIILGDNATPEAVAKLRAEMGLDDPFLVRYFRFVKDLLRGDLGICYATKQPVFDRLIQTFPNTVKLAAFAVVVSTIMGLSLGIISAAKQYSLFDNIAMLLAMMGNAMPNFWQGLLLMLVFSLWLGWLPASGFSSFKHMILPALTMGTSSAAVLARMTRSSMLEVIRADYISTARAKGQTEFKVIMHHAFRNAMIPVITTIGLQFGRQLGGAVLTESIFAIPGVGKMMVDAIKARNYPVVQGGVLLIALSLSIVNLVVDILYAYIDPRIKSQYK
ncbi:MAG: ABC transporter permease [Tepidanaerobacteraceae bacterium]|jgi:peptide/nickel transport system permease protein